MGLFDDVLGGGSEAASVSNDSGGLFDDVLKPKKQNKGIMGDIGGALSEGAKSAGRSIAGTANIYTGNEAGLVEKAKAQEASQANKPAALAAFNQAVESRIKPLGEDPGLWDSVKAIGGAVIEQPKGAGLAIVEQLPNAAPAMVGGLGGMKAGAALGTAVAPGVGTAIGAVGGGLAGMFLGNAAIETGYKGIEAAQDGSVTPEEFSRARKEGAIKAGVITGVDALTLGLSKAVTNIPARAVESATRNALAKAGVDVSNEAAVLAAKQSPDISAAVRAAQESAFASANTLGKRAAAGGAALGLETVGEGLGEYLGELAATGKANVADAVLEAVLSLGQSSAEVAWGATRNKKSEQQGIWSAAQDATRTIIADPVPLQRRIDGMIGINTDSMSDKDRAQYEKDLTAAFLEPVGVTQDANGLEIPFTMADYLNGQVRAEDESRAQPLRQNARQSADTILQQVADEEAQQQPDFATGNSGFATGNLFQPSIPVVGPLSAAANLAVQTGAHASAVAQQAAAQAAQNTTPEGKAGTPAGAQSNSAAPAQGPLTEVASVSAPNTAQVAPNITAQAPNIGGNTNAAKPTPLAQEAPQANDAQAGATAAPQAAPAGQGTGGIDLSNRTDTQLNWLVQRGKNGNKEAAVAELKRRGVQIENQAPANTDAIAPAESSNTDQKKVDSETVPALNAGNSVNFPATSISSLQDQLNKPGAVKDAAPAADSNGFVHGQNGYKTRIAQHKAGSNLLDPTADVGAFTYEVRKGDNDPNPMNMAINKDGNLVPTSRVLGKDGKSNGTAWVPANQEDAEKVRILLGQRAKTEIGSTERKAIDAQIKEVVTGNSNGGTGSMEPANQNPIKNEYPAAATDSAETGGQDQEPIKKDEQPKNASDRLRSGEINVEQFMEATGLTDDDVGTFSSNGARNKADAQAKKESRYHAGIEKISAAIFEAERGLTRGSTAQSRRAYQANVAKYRQAQETLGVIAKHYEHPFKNTLLSKLPPFLESRFGKQWDGIEHGDSAKRAFHGDSYRKWVDLLIGAADNKNGTPISPAVSQPKTDAAPEAKQAKAQASKLKARNKIEPEKDSLFVAIAKAGGMDTDELLSNGIDSNDITFESAARVKKDGQLSKKRRMPLSFGFALPLHKKGGMSFDAMREAMQQYGYMPQGATKNDAIDLFRQELSGEPVLTPQAIEQQQSQDQEEFDKMMQEEQDRIDAELAAQEIAEDETGFNDFGVDGQEIYADFAEFAFGDNGKQDDNATRAGMRALGFTEEEINDELGKNSQAKRESEEIASGRGQESGNGRDGNGAQDAQARERGGEEGFNLAGQTNTQAAEKFAQQQAAKDNEAADKKAADDKAKADAEANDFRLAGSDRAADVAIAGGQVGLFGANGRPTKSAEQSTAPDSRKPEEKKPASDAELERRILIAADSIDKLRKVDVERVLMQGNIDQQKMAEYIKRKRVDLAGEVDDVMAESQPSVSQPKTDTAPESKQEAAPASDSDTRFAKNTIFTADRVAAAKARMKAKLGTMNSGIDPELLIDGMTIAGAYIESGVRKFSDYAKAMVEDLGDGVKPYLLSFYEAARAYPGLNKMGMDSAEAAASQHQALLTPEVKEAAKEVIGETPKVEKKKPASLGESIKLKADWGVQNIDGYTASRTGKNQQTDYGLKGGVKDEFLNDASRYLKAVEKLLQEKGFSSGLDRKGKPAKAVSINEGGPAVGGDVYLEMSAGDFHVYAQVGVTNVRGMGPEHPQGVSLMVRAGQKNSMNNWLATDLTAGDLAAWFDKQHQAFAKRSAEVKPAAPAKTSYDLSKADDKFKVATEIADFLIGGGEFKTIIEARKKISEMIGRPIEAATELAKQADETIETAVVLAGRDIVKAGRKQGRSAEVIYDRLVDLYRRQPNLAVRSSTSVRDQAYSTPVPLAYLASELAGITYDTKVLEPTAGNGMLLIGASIGNSVVNELNPDRADVLRSLGFNPTERNAATEQLRHAGYPVDAVIANPPFGATKDANGETIVYDIKPGFQTREVDHAIVFKSLETMKDDGRAVLIVGGVQSEEEEFRREDYRGKNKRTFYYNLYNEYNVIDHFTADGGLYSKQGASYPVDIIVIDGRGKSSRDLPAADLPVIFKSYDALKEKLNGNGRMESKPVVGANGTDSGNGQAGQGNAPGLAGSPVGSSVKDGDGSASGVSAGGVRNDGLADNGRPIGSWAVSSGGKSESANASGSVDGVRVSDANRNAEAGSKAGNRGNRPDDLGGISVVNGERVESGLTDRRGQEQETGHQVAYDPHSNAASVGTLVPRAMKDSIAASLQKISDEVGSIDDYVAESLAMDLEDVKANFSAEQIDALALAIRNAEAGKGFIIGDQTGIGKGRVVAAMIRYALVTGKTPIFVTEKPNLYSDMIRDLDDIGMTAELALDTKNPKVMITNGGESIPYTLLRTENGEVVENNLLLRAPKSGKALDQIMQGMMDGDSLGEYKVIFTTYSQLQTVKGATTTRQKFIQQFGEGNYMVFDESHNAGGAGDTQARTKEQRQAAKDGESLVTGRASFVRHLVQKAFGTFFSSATYAKRPDVMDLYSSTNMKLAVDKISQLGEAIKSGGVPMQQVVANMLTKDGQYIRRERTFAGVSYDTQETKVDKGTAENMASAMRSILAFSRAKDSVIKEIQKEMDREGGMINEMGGEKSSVQGANFGSIMHNLIDQMLLSLKVQDSVAHAIERLKAGEKVVMTVSNTMGSFLKDYSEELGIATGDPVSMSFADLYNRYLEKQRNVTIKDGGGNKRQHRLTDAELGPRLVDMFNAVRKQIESSGFGSAPISPIDYMHNELRKAGYKTDEITGRTISLNYSSGTPILASRTANIRQRVKAVSGFNNGETDVLILNQAGSTGLSLHASSKFKDQRKRHMIIVQAEKNIDTHMQMLGRVHRTGQVVAPAYSQMMADIPAEMRPASVLMKKMASLNANTTASRTSSVTAEGVVDFMNNYGGQVVHEYLRDNPDVLESVGGSKVIALGDDPAEAGEDDIRKFTGYIPILPIKQQEEVYRELVDRYNELIERENSLGTNKLEAKAVDLDAETISSQTVTEDRGDPSVFASPANMEKVDVKRTVKPFSSEEVAAMVLERLGGSAANIIASKQSTELYELAMAYSKEKIAKLLADGVDPVKVESQKAQLQLVLSHARTVLSTYKIGDSISVKDQIGQFVYGVITNIERSGRTANPAAGSAWKMHIALANGDAKSITINFSQIGSKYELRGENRVEWYNTDTQSVERITVYDIFDKGAKVRREKRWIVTGNILAGFARFPGQIITYTKNDGTTAQGVLMSRQFDFEKEQKNAPVRIKDGKSAIKFFTNGGQGGIIGTPDRFLMIAPRRGEFEITVPSSKKDGGTYYLDTGLTNIVGDFYKRGSIMSASVYTTGDVERVVDYLVKGREETIIALSNVEKAKELLEGNTGSGNIAAPSTISPADKAIYGMAAEGKSAADILKFIASASRNPFYRQLAKLLMKTGITPSITVGDGKGWKFNAGEGNKYAAGYNPKSNTISLFRPASAERNMLHELTHAATLKALSGKGMAAAQMKALYQHVKKSGKLKGMYGMSDVDEFIAEAFSNPKFQEQLKKVAAPKASAGTLSSAWNWFVRIVRGILGVSANEENALAQALEIGVDVMRENMKAGEADGGTRYATGPKQTESEAFRKWFGDSKVVDANGDPLVVYHGTGATDINEFKVSERGTYGGGIYLTPDIRGANDYAIYRGAPSSTVYPVYAAIKNPASGSEAAQVASWKGEENAREELIRRGYDGVVDMRSGEIVAFYPSQVKSAIGNNGNYDASTGDVRYNAAPGKINQTDTEAFKRWFGDSAVVDSDGKPLRVFHGTASDITAFDIGRSGESTGNTGFYGAGAYFSEDADYASGFSFWARRSDDQAPNVVPVYLSLKNPAYINITPRSQAASEKSRATAEKIISTMIARGTDQAVVDKLQGFVSENKFEPFMGTLYNALGGGTGTTALLKEAGFDGVTIYGGISGKEKLAEAVAFDPTQIKSAIGNYGDFDGSNPDIRYNVADDHWDVSEPSKMDDVIYAMQDKQIDLKRVVQAIKGAGRRISDAVNPYLQEELFHGRAAKGVKDFLDFELRPLLKQMQDQGVDMGDFEEYLWNRHAEERNAQIAKINKDMPDGGSGIETAAARAYLAGLPAERRRAFDSMAAKVDAMNRNSQRVLVESGLEKQSTIDAWNGAYKHYVPLQREDVDTGHVGTGKGFSVRGSSTKRAMGSGKAVVDIIANLTMQRERNIVRAEKNRVSNALMGLAVQNPNADFWKVDQAPKERVVEQTAIYTVNDAAGNKLDDFTSMREAERFANQNPGSEIEQTWGDRVKERVTPGFTSRDNVILTRVNGEDHYVIFNERNERAMRMAGSMKNLDVDNMGRVLSIVGKATRYLSSINTQYNPVFGVINLIRDTQGALINLSSTPLAGEQKRVLGYTKDALIGIYKDIRAHRAGRRPSSNWATLFEEFQKEGGQTGYRDQYANAEARAEAIKSELEQFKEGKAKQLTRGLFGWLSDYNETMENAVRLAAYKAGTEKGMSKQQAASLAKNITVNFNRKGQVATQVGALYAFFNASVQGTARIAETLFEQNDGNTKNIRLSKTGKKIIAGGIMLGSMQAMLLAAAGFDDDEPPEFIRERNLILPIGNGKYLTLAMPLGLHVLPGIGRLATEFVMSGGDKPLNKLAAFGGMFADAFNPVGSAGWSLQTITPSVVDPLAALAENKDFTGKQIYQANFNSLNPTPGHSRAKDTATVWSKAISEGMNFITGGSEYRPGLFSPTPDQIDYLIGQATGGVGREISKAVQTSESAMTGEDMPLYKVPLVGRFVGDTEGKSGQSQKFYDNLRQLNAHEAEYKGLLKDGRRQEASEYLAENPAVRQILLGNHAESAVKKLREAKRNLMESGAPSEKVSAMEERIAQTMKSFNEKVQSLR